MYEGRNLTLTLTLPVVQACIAGEKEDDNMNIQLFYPNPSSNYITLTYPGSRIEITDLNGHNILSTKPRENTVSVSDLSPGLYLAIIRDGHTEIGRDGLLIH